MPTNLKAGNVVPVSFFGDANALARSLVNLHGHQFMAYTYALNMDELDAREQPKRMKKRNNPWLGRGLVKIGKAQLTACLDYDKKVERRNGEAPAKKGNWLQAVIVDGKLTPLATHKKDIVTSLVPGDKDILANRIAVMNDSGSVQFTVDNPRLYLRYEIVRDHGDGQRQTRKMRSETHYYLPDGTEVSKEEVEPFLKSRKSRKDETDMQVTALDNVLELRIGKIVYVKREINLPTPVCTKLKMSV